MQVTPPSSPRLTPLPSKTNDQTGPGFKDALLDSIKQVNNLQAKAHEAMEGLAAGRHNNIHETMIAMQKAETSFKMLSQVRNKVMDAYKEIMRMPV